MSMTANQSMARTVVPPAAARRQAEAMPVVSSPNRSGTTVMASASSHNLPMGSATGSKCEGKVGGIRMLLASPTPRPAISRSGATDMPLLARGVPCSLCAHVFPSGTDMMAQTRAMRSTSR
jgi:hypothetical protein